MKMTINSPVIDKVEVPYDIYNVHQINSIEKLYKPLRQLSKAPTFALTYSGTYRTLMTNCGFSESEAKTIEAKYHSLYQESDKWVNDRVNQGSTLGYVEVAFGLRVRTPLLQQSIRGTKKTPYEVEAEARTVGNALGQSWGLLNTRASSEFMGKVRLEKYSLDIKPCAHIHDAQYYLVRDDIDALLYLNKHLVKAIEWQAHPDIQHNTVHLGGEVTLFHPTWADEISIPNNVDEIQLQYCITEALYE